MPPGASPTLWNADERYRETYLDPFPDHYLTADAGYVDEEGYVFVMAHRRHHQRRGHRLDGSDRGGARSPRGRRRVRRDRRRRRLEGPASARPRGPTMKAGVERPHDPRHLAGSGQAGPRPDRARRLVQDVRRRGAAAEDPIRARSCAGRCAASPTSGSTPSRRRSTILRSSTRSRSPFRAVRGRARSPHRLTSTTISFGGLRRASRRADPRAPRGRGRPDGAEDVSARLRFLIGGNMAVGVSGRRHPRPRGSR